MHKLKRRVSPKDPSKTWQDVVVISKLHPDCLPQHLGQGDSRQVCRLLSNLGQGAQTSGSPGITTKRKYVFVGKKYLQVEYELRVFVEQESLRFEAIVGEGEGESETVQAQWIYTEDDQLAEDTQDGQLQDSIYDLTTT